MEIMLFSIFLVAALLLQWQRYVRCSTEVLEDLRKESQSDPRIKPSESRRSHSRAKQQQSRNGITLLSIGLLGVCSLYNPRVLPFLGAVLLVGFLYSRMRQQRKQQREQHRMDFYLPIVMERIVMAVQSGLDVLSAIDVVANLRAERINDEHGEETKDPVSKLLHQVQNLTERGMQLHDALLDVAGTVSSSGVRHAFMHLALAHKEGGELIAPLRELSDATQLYNQESIEERIAKLPVKATLPLLCTFAGLIICFITPPLAQVLELTNQPYADADFGRSNLER